MSMADLLDIIAVTDKESAAALAIAVHRIVASYLESPQSPGAIADKNGLAFLKVFISRLISNIEPAKRPPMYKSLSVAIEADKEAAAIARKEKEQKNLTNNKGKTFGKVFNADSFDNPLAEYEAQCEFDEKYGYEDEDEVYEQKTAEEGYYDDDGKWVAYEHDIIKEEPVKSKLEEKADDSLVLAFLNKKNEKKKGKVLKL
eukprot:Tbor_TRINITY_DN9213_c0_g1::TRINITY_DN9213_c0_g1_i1::g.3241::m.3241